ncbi:ankyrin repeat domain-containing protein 54-like [Oppia nitens]|uniref:ankyrin repeat domain-containing protein 54-like n=1 Tax=Oppia nitens TaxID=1686743 RepID=UPI0023D9A277|nr:ankyrin repeat domain-containing protein 54-like [Oppia nitens]
MSADDSGVDAGSNASDDSIGMSLASSVSDYDRDEFNDNAVDIAVIDNNINRDNEDNNGNNQSDFEFRMIVSSSPSTSSIPAMASVASTSVETSTSSHLLPSSSHHYPYDSLCLPSSSHNNRMVPMFDNQSEHSSVDYKSDNNVQVFNDLNYNSEEQHDLKPKMRSIRPKSHDIKRKHISKDITGERLLRRSANCNDIETVRRLLDEGIDPVSCDERSRTALHFAACKGNTQIAQLLLEKGANPNQKDAIGNTPLHLAACTNNIQVITLLLSAGTDIHSLDNSGRTPLHLAQSKLKLIQSMQRSDSTINSKHLKNEVMQVLEMMSIYWHRSGKNAELELLTTFTNRLHLSQTSEEVGTDVSDLLTSLSHLSL